jgi:hypothetical protein
MPELLRFIHPTGPGQRHPYVFHVGGQEYRVDYLPAESDSGIFGGNSNWGGPIWFPVDALYEYFHGDNGAGLGASHQTGWTGLMGGLIHLFGLLDPKRFLEEGRRAAFDHGEVKRRTSR